MKRFSKNNRVDCNLQSNTMPDYRPELLRWRPWRDEGLGTSAAGRWSPSGHGRQRAEPTLGELKLHLTCLLFSVVADSGFCATAGVVCRERFAVGAGGGAAPRAAQRAGVNGGCQWSPGGKRRSCERRRSVQRQRRRSRTIFIPPWISKRLKVIPLARGTRRFAPPSPLYFIDEWIS